MSNDATPDMTDGDGPARGRAMGAAGGAAEPAPSIPAHSSPAVSMPAASLPVPSSSAHSSSAPSMPVQSTPYHRLATLRPEWRRWWRPLTTAFAITAIWLILASLLMVGMVLVLTALGADRSIGQALDDPTSPLDVFVRSALGALLIPAGLLGVRLGGWRPTSLLWSVADRFRTAQMGRMLALAVVAVALAAAMQILLHGGRPAPPESGRTIGVVLVLLLVAPLQAAGEELVLRGAVMQGVGTWVRGPVVPILATLPLSLIGAVQSLDTAFTAVFIALASGVLAWRTGGIEASIVLRTVVLLTAGVVGLLGMGAETTIWFGAMLAFLVLVNITGYTRRDSSVETVAVLGGARGPFFPVMRSADAPVPPPVRV
ncbi:CPBP family glutamic-type intramembrane protease [Brachybacterium nesterenkovii]|uniref:CPBP family glutamic-type intramembrane protease n=1 Tax=Brachybacterium nesterenkovii TaxID=47847 RepID=UPI003219FBEA